MAVKRCAWAKDAYSVAYHDNEWCQEEHDDNKLFEMLILEGMQAGLSWSLILKRRESMREAFDGFDPAIIQQYDDDKKAALLQNPGIIRNRRKVDALVENAKAFFRVREEFGSFDAYVWGFVNGTPVQHALQSSEEMPATNEISDAMSKDMKQRGFKFVGSTILYSYMQAVGMVNDHEVGCDWHEKCKR